MSAFFVTCINCTFYITKVIQTVKDTNDIDTIGNRFLNEVCYYVICIVTIAKDILATKQHLCFCVFQAISDLTKSIPWIFM